MKIYNFFYHTQFGVKENEQTKNILYPEECVVMGRREAGGAGSDSRASLSSASLDNLG